MTHISNYSIVDIFEKMIEKNVDFNLQNETGKTALMMALENKQTETAKLLIEQAVNLNLMDEDGNTAMHFAIRHCRKTKLVNMLIQKNADLNLQNLKGQTALMITAELFKDNNEEDEKSLIEIAKLLIQHGANLNLINKNGYTALIISLSYNLELAQLLIQAGAQLNIKYKMNETAFFQIFKNILVFNLFGEQIFTNNNLSKNNLEIATDQLSNGVYIFSIQTENTSKRERVIIQK
jgi:ankyrin repeat protein